MYVIMYNDVAAVFYCERSAIVVTVSSCSCLDIVAVVRLLNCKRRPAHLVWNVAVTEIALRVFHIPVHEEERIIKESRWRRMKMIFKRTVL